MPKSLSLKQVADALGARLDCASAQEADTLISGLAPIDRAAAGQITFVTNPKYTSQARTTQASAVIVAEDFAGLPKPGVAALRVKNPHVAYAKAIELFHPQPKYAPGIHPSAAIDPSAKIGKNVHIGAFVAIGKNVVIGDDCILHPHVVIYDNVQIGDNFLAHAHAVVREDCRIGNSVILQSGVIVGCDGYGFAKTDDGKWRKIFQSGNVVIGDRVEIQANSCIDRAGIGETHIRDGVKIDNLVQVAHGCDIGENTLLCSQVGLAGSTEIGKNAVLAGQVGVVGHLRIGDNVVVTAQSGIPGDVEDGKVVSGSPAFDNKQWLKSISVFNKLPELAKAVRANLSGKSSTPKD